ncbi:5-oxoprolinase subunit PxpB [Colwellia sp. TT2012]|uniref:5-oxoprolinase subunit PxpB n=1 Tax=Colwellia sp. TT2012 TaxID=1720342 RepID=UPI00070EFD93|nr:5-oxoprolinase subunit PxpB [Colwellia sp. TT2012]
MKINDTIHLDVAGENALILYFSPREQSSLVVSAEINRTVQQAEQLIRQHLSAVIVDLIPSYASILVVFDLLKIDHHHLRNQLQELLKQCNQANSKPGRLIELPSYYSLESGMDLVRIAKHAKLSVEQVIALHQGQEYRVYAIGFAPGFAYLGEVDERIAMPRLTSPRLKVPKGAVAIADRQTAVYPAQSPGGWNIIGLCPVDMFNPQAKPVMPLAVGDRVKFIAIDRQQYLNLGGKLS